MKKALMLFLFVSVAAGAQETTLNLSLQEAQAYAVKNSYEVRNMDLEVEKAEQVISETRAMGLPHISSGFDYQWNPQVAQQPVPAEFFGGEPGSFTTVAFGVEHQNTAHITLNQLLLDASYFVALKAARVVREEASRNLEKSRINIEANTAKAYYSALIARENVKTIEENLLSLKRNLFEVGQLYESGFVEEQDVDQLDLLVNTQENRLNEASRQENIAIMLLKFYLGVEQSAEVHLTDEIMDILVVEPEEALVLNAFNPEQHIDYRSVLTQEKGAMLQLTYDKMALVPKLRGFVRHSHSNFSNDFADAFSFNTFWIPATTIGVGISWDLFKGGGRFATIKKSNLDLKRIEVAREMTENNLKLNYQRSRSDYIYALDNFNAQLKNLDISKKIRDKTRIKYKEGISSSLDLTQAENQYLETQSNYIQSLLMLLNSKEELKKALGKSNF